VEGECTLVAGINMTGPCVTLKVWIPPTYESASFGLTWAEVAGVVDLWSPLPAGEFYYCPAAKALSYWVNIK